MFFCIPPRTHQTWKPLVLTSTLLTPLLKGTNPREGRKVRFYRRRPIVDRLDIEERPGSVAGRIALSSRPIKLTCRTRRRAMSWVRLLKRVFDIDIEHCSNCGRSLKIIAAIEDSPVIVKILSHIGLPVRAPPRALAQRFDLF